MLAGTKNQWNFLPKLAIIFRAIFFTCEWEMTNEAEMLQELEKLRAENAALKKTSERGLSLKVSEKGAVSVYGLGRFPVTLYKEQWAKLLAMADEIKAFIAANDSRLKAKE